MPPKRQQSPEVPENSSQNQQNKQKKTKASSQNLPLNSILSKLDTLMDQNDSLKSSVQQMEKNVYECKETIKKSIDEIKEEFRNNLSEHGNRIQSLESNVSTLERDVKWMKQERERIYYTMNKLNLILINLREVPNETQNQLLDRVNETISNTHPSIIPDIKNAYRIGKVKFDSSRPVKVVFRNIESRDACFQSRRNLEKPIVLNEDLAFETRKDHSALLKMRSDALACNPDESVSLQLFKKQIVIGNRLIKVMQGEVSEERLNATQARQIHQRQPPPRRNNQATDYPASTTHHSTRGYVNFEGSVSSHSSPIQLGQHRLAASSYPGSSSSIQKPSASSSFNPPKPTQASSTDNASANFLGQQPTTPPFFTTSIIPWGK